MGINLKVGDKIPLGALLTTRETTKFVRAIVRDAAGTEIAGSPFTLPHLAGGFYFLDTPTMPSTDHIMVEYDSFDDSLFTVPSELEPDAERFDLDDIGSAIDSLLNASTRSDLGAELADVDDLGAEVLDTDAISAEISDDEAFDAEISDDDGPIDVTLDDNDLGAEIGDC